MSEVSDGICKVKYSANRGEPEHAVNIVSQIARGDLTTDVKTSDHDSNSLLFSIRGMRNDLASIISHVRLGAYSIVNVSSEIATGNMDLSNRTEQQVKQIEQVEVA